MSAMVVEILCFAKFPSLRLGARLSSSSSSSFFSVECMSKGDAFEAGFGLVVSVPCVGESVLCSKWSEMFASAFFFFWCFK